ncbi:MAG: helix-turn-helix transcriptional regulator [Sphingomonadales bacterium]|nr:helix-turn-helix transcriptional regulator [Sphingomonadales bacterium]
MTVPPAPAATPATIAVEAALATPTIDARIVRFDMPSAQDNVTAPSGRYHVNLCLTPRPLNARAGYVAHWGPHRFDRLGDIFLVPPGESLHFRGDPGRQASLTCDLSPEPVAALIGRELEWTDQRLAATLDITSARIRALLFRMTEEVRHPGLAAETMLDLFASELAIEIGRFCLEVHERPVTGGLAGWRLRLIDERLADESRAPGLAELADICNISVRQLTRGFRTSRGCSIGDHVEQRRMEAAKRRLMAGDSVKAVAFAMGFASPSSFTFAFRRAVGISPNQFRQRQLRVAKG